ncbi:hypothetical protein EIP91_007354 [Steccherinum ochraceum]|uniref:Enoyl reductase (ER) domain-containing protein n=1 Tax=Steccherinum ochraceum TaxID=92696 RepID=A0A4V2MXV9_9APHY|nr:hypothetical protein EIP91_007354 [Steccherinum ochraceum]
MAPVTNGRLLFTGIPEVYAIAGKDNVYDTSETIDLDNVPLNGGMLFKILVLSIDPYLRDKMRGPDSDAGESAYKLGKPIEGFGVGEILRSENSQHPAGSHLVGWFPFQQYWVGNSVQYSYPVAPMKGVPWSAHVGVAGMPGSTGYMGWKEFSKAKAGETVFVSAAAGCVGATVAQLAKAEGLKVIGSAGTDEKVEFLKSIGVDVAFNYKKVDTNEVLKKEGPIDIYWDNVGGPTLDAALANSNRYSRFIECGMLTVYNGGETYTMKNLNMIYRSEITVSGFTIPSLMPKYPEFYVEVPKLISEGKMKFNEDITVGLENAGAAFEANQLGKSTGKSIVLVAE